MVNLRNFRGGKLKYHRKADGTLGVCKAKNGRCPYAGDAEHIYADNVADAQNQLDKINEEMVEADTILSANNGNVKGIKSNNPYIIAEQIRQYGMKYPKSDNVHIQIAQIQNGQHLEEYINDPKLKDEIKGYYQNQASLGNGSFEDNKYIFKKPKNRKLNSDNPNRYNIKAIIFSEDGPVYECDMNNTAKAYAKELEHCYNSSVAGRAVTKKTPNELIEETKYVLVSTDGHAGALVTHNGEIGAVFSNGRQYSSKSSSHIIKKTFSTLKANGGKWLNCYNTNLPSLYAEQGLYVNSYLDINEDYVPDEYKTEEFINMFPNFNKGVVFMSVEKKPVKRFKNWEDAEEYTKGGVA